MSITQSALLGGRIRLGQPSEGYRAGMDALLLAAACDAKRGARVLDAGCGVGAVMLAAAVLNPLAHFVGIERDPEIRVLALANIALNGLEGRISVASGEVGAAFASLGLAPFDTVLANPPYFDDPATLRAPAPAKLGAWITPEGLEVWLAFLIGAVREKGEIILIHRADRLADILAGLGAKCGSFQIRPLAPFADAPAKRVIVRAVRAGRAPLQLLAPLVLHDRASGAKHTPAVEAILRGEARLGWA